MYHFKNKRDFVFGLLVILLVSCSGGGDGDSKPDGASVITGTAAGGAPIVGLVNVKGVNDATASTTIESDGTYVINVDALTPPFILYAEGAVNGIQVKYYSMGISDGVINITGITDYIIRHAVAGDPNAAFDGWASSQVTVSALSAAETLVQQQIQPLLTFVNVDEAVDLISTPFTNDQTGLDLVLEAIVIEYNGSDATVTNSLTGSSYIDNLTTTADDAAGLPISDADIIAAVDLNGLWQTDCIEDQDGNFFKQIIEINGTDFKNTTLAYISDCNLATPVLGALWEYNYFMNLGGLVTTADGQDAYDLDVTFSNSFLTMKFQAVTDFWNAQPDGLCGKNDWILDVTVNITGHPCNIDTASSGEIYYNIVKLDTTITPNAISFGVRSTDINTRPQTIVTWVYTKITP